MAFLNIASLPKHIDEIRVSELFKSLDLFAFNETRLDSTISDGEVKICGYDLVRKDRCRNGGGVCTYLRSSINYKIRNDLIPSELEGVCLEIIKPHSRPFIVASVYRPPNDCSELFFANFESLVKDVDNEDKEIHILGDLNCNMLKAISDYPTKNLKQVFETYQLCQTINEPTRITSSTSTLIDHHVTNSEENVVKSGVIHLGISDHSLIYAIRKINYVYKVTSNHINEFRNMKRFDEKLFTADLLSQPWLNITAENDINSLWSSWKSMFLTVLDKHAPVIKKRSRVFNVPWFTKDIKHLIFSRDRLKRKAIITNKNEYWDEYKTFRNKVNIAMRQAKSTYYQDKISVEKDDPKKAWKTINCLLGRSRSNIVVNELEINDHKVNSPEELADAFNKYFVNIGPQLAHKMNSTNVSFENFVTPSSSVFSEFHLVSSSKVFKLLSSLSSSKASGIDKISGRVLKISANVIAPSISYIMNYAISSCCFPDEWKLAKVHPLFKKGSRNLPDNYRPISILPAISKIMERFLYDQLYEYLLSNNILFERQFGFRKQHSTASALLDCTNNWYFNMDRQLFNLVVFLDLKKAFDTVNHGVLLRKMELYGLTGNALQLMNSYLSCRKQICQVNGVSSNVKSIGCGIPQGSILGPLFFLLYINDLPRCLNQAIPRLFADDTNLTVAGESVELVERAMNRDLENVKTWLLANKLSLNVAKTEFLLIGSRHNIRNLDVQPDLRIGQHPLKQVTHSRVLGVEIDQYLSWGEHIDVITKKLTSGIGAIRRIRNFVDQPTLISVHNAIVQPYFDYCSEVWDTLGEGLSKRLQKLQNRSARVILHMTNDTPSKEALLALGWESLEEQRFKNKAKHMFKILNYEAPKCLVDLFTRKQQITNYSLRGSSTSLQLPLPKTESGRRCFAYNGAKVWNSLPEKARECVSLTSFKTELLNL